MSTINPGEGWRLLKKGELIQDGDEFFKVKDGGHWHATSDAGKLVGQFHDLSYRRRTSDWIKTSERLPTKEDGDDDQQILVARDGSQFVSFWHTAKEFSLWRKLPPLPQPEAWEEAFVAEWDRFDIEIQNRDTYRNEARRFWNAGVEWQNKQTQNQTPQ